MIRRSSTNSPKSEKSNHCCGHGNETALDEEIKKKKEEETNSNLNEKLDAYMKSKLLQK